MGTIKTIMIVDDSEADHIIAKFAIRGYDPEIETISVYDGAEALSVLHSLDEAPDIIFLDINMPGMNGYEFLDVYEKNENELTTVVAMLTSSATESVEGYSMVKDYIVKPLESAHLEKLAALQL